MAITTKQQRQQRRNEDLQLIADGVPPTDAATQLSQAWGCSRAGSSGQSLPPFLHLLDALPVNTHVLDLIGRGSQRSDLRIVLRTYDRTAITPEVLAMDLGDSGALSGVGALQTTSVQPWGADFSR